MKKNPFTMSPVEKFYAHLEQERRESMAKLEWTRIYIQAWWGVQDFEGYYGDWQIASLRRIIVESAKEEYGDAAEVVFESERVLISVNSNQIEFNRRFVLPKQAYN